MATPALRCSRAKMLARAPAQSTTVSKRAPVAGEVPEETLHQGPDAAQLAAVHGRQLGEHLPPPRGEAQLDSSPVGPGRLPRDQAAVREAVHQLDRAVVLDDEL